MLRETPKKPHQDIYESRCEETCYEKLQKRSSQDNYESHCTEDSYEKLQERPKDIYENCYKEDCDEKFEGRLYECMCAGNTKDTSHKNLQITNYEIMRGSVQKEENGYEELQCNGGIYDCIQVENQYIHLI